MQSPMKQSIQQMRLSKSDDLIYHHEVKQEKSQNIRNSFFKQNSLYCVNLEIPKLSNTKRNSFHSVIANFEDLKVKQNQVKKKVLTQIAQFGYNAYMAEYLLEKTKIKLDQKYETILEQLIDQIHQVDAQYQTTCSKQKHQKKRNIKQIIPISSNEEEVIQIDQFVEEIRIIKKPQILAQSRELNKDPQNCGICLCELIDKRQLLNCKHEFCLKCIQEYLNNKINCAQVLEINCPQQDCYELYTDNVIKEIVNEEFYQKYEKFKLTKILEKDDTVRWCVRPGCDKYVKGNMFSQVVKCECGQEICYDCRREYHPGLSCEQALDKYYEQTLKQLIIQRCPKCKAPIQKREGCNHMTCYQCRFQFCWLCRARYTRMHFDSDNCFGCPDKQFSGDDPYKRPSWKKYGGICFEFFASILILPLIPFILMYYSIMGPLKLLKRMNRKYYKEMEEEEKVCFIFLGILLFPFSVILLIFPGIFMLLAYKIRYD